MVRDNSVTLECRTTIATALSPCQTLASMGWGHAIASDNSDGTPVSQLFLRRTPRSASRSSSAMRPTATSLHRVTRETTPTTLRRRSDLRCASAAEVRPDPPAGRLRGYPIPSNYSGARRSQSTPFHSRCAGRCRPDTELNRKLACTDVALSEGLADILLGSAV